MARCPNYGWKESEEYARAEELKEKIAGIGACSRRAPGPRALRHRASPSLALFPPFFFPLGLSLAEAKAKKRWEANFF